MRYSESPSILIAEGYTRLFCGACGIAFDIPFRHRCRVAGLDAQEDREAATDRIIEDELHFHWNRACPECAAMPARSVSSRRTTPDLFIALGGLSLCGLAGAAVAAMWMTGEMVGVWLVIIGFGAVAQLLAHLAVARWHSYLSTPRSITSTNSLKPAIVLEGGGHLERPEWPTRTVPSYLLGAAAVIAFSTAAFHFAHAEIVNADTRPGVVAPGSEVRVKFKSTLTSLGGAWAGRAEAHLLDDRHSKVGVTVPSPESLESRQFTSKDHEQKFHPEILIHIPDDAALVGREVMVEVRMQPAVVVLVGSNCKFEVKDEIVERIPVRVAPKPAADFYKLVIRTGAILGAVFSIAAALQMYRIDRRLGQFPEPDVYVSKRKSDEERLLKEFSWKEYRAGRKVVKED